MISTNTIYPYLDEMNEIVHFSEKIAMKQYATTKWNGVTKNHYINKGYIFTNFHDDFTVDVRDLTRRSRVKVMPICNICANKKKRTMVTFSNIFENNTTNCNGCAKIKDLTGQVFGRWSVLDIVIDEDSLKTKWLCECSCGNKVIVCGTNLIQGRTKSCGCLNIEINKSRNGEKSPVWGIRGEDHHRWNPNLTEEDRKGRRTAIENVYWAKQIKIENDFICQCCDQRGGDLESHHLNNYSDFPDLRLELNNGITLCKSCHSNFHSWMGGNIIKCTKKDFINYCNEHFPDCVFLLQSL